MRRTAALALSLFALVACGAPAEEPPVDLAPINGGPYGIGVDKNAPELTTALQKALQALIGDGTYRKLLQVARDGMTMIVVTHEVGFARQVADSVVFLVDGAVVQAGPPGQVLDNPRQLRTQQFLAKVL